jgi:hypothetical protein
LCRRFFKYPTHFNALNQSFIFYGNLATIIKKKFVFPKKNHNSLLTKVDWLNQYNKDIRDKVGPRLSASYKNDYDYMIRITEPFKYASMLRECGRSDFIGSGMNLKAGMIGSLLTILTSLRYFL